MLPRPAIFSSLLPGFSLLGFLRFFAQAVCAVACIEEVPFCWLPAPFSFAFFCPYLFAEEGTRAPPPLFFVFPQLSLLTVRYGPLPIFVALNAIARPSSGLPGPGSSRAFLTFPYSPSFLFFSVRSLFYSFVCAPRRLTRPSKMFIQYVLPFPRFELADRIGTFSP